MLALLTLDSIAAPLYTLLRRQSNPSCLVVNTPEMARNRSENEHTQRRRMIMIRETQERLGYSGTFEGHLTASPVIAAHQGECIVLI